MLDAETPQSSQVQKAAMLVQFLINEGAEFSVSALPEAVQVRLAQELATMRLVDRHMLDDAARDFTRQLEDLALAAPGSVEGAIKALDGRLSSSALARLRHQAADGHAADPWARVLDLDEDGLRAILTAESTEVGAVVLSKLPTARAATVLGQIPGDRARQLALAVSRIAGIRPETVHRIAGALATTYCAQEEAAFHHTPSQRVGAILNAASTATRDQVLEALGKDDPDFAETVRKAIFTFADIPSRLGQTDVPGVLRDLSQSDLVVALAGAEAEGGLVGEAAGYLLANMSKRLAETLRDEMSEKGKVRKSEAEAAQAAIVTAIREAADAGRISLVVEEEED